jgi:hypothetical protein
MTPEQQTIIDLIREQVAAYRGMSDLMSTPRLSAYDPVSSIHAADVAVLLDAYDALLNVTVDVAQTAAGLRVEWKDAAGALLYSLPLTLE